MSKFYILSEDDLNNLSSTEFTVVDDDAETIGGSFICYNASVYKEDVISLKDLRLKAREVEFDGDLREFVKEKIENDKNVQDLMNKLAITPRAGALLTPDEVRNVLKEWE